MSAVTAPVQEMNAVQKIPQSLIMLIAAACGIIVANIYYAQPLAGPISRDLGLSQQAAGLIVTMTQVGYGLGLLLIVPMGDLFENRRLIISVILLCALALVVAAISPSAIVFLPAMLGIGFLAVSVQILVPFAANLATDATRGRVVGNVMGGLMMGIMLARPVASFVTQMFSWHAVFYGSSVAMVLLAILLSRALPRRMPESTLGYGALLNSMIHLLMRTPMLQRRSLYHACMFGAYSLFWTTTPLLLSGPEFNMSQAGIALFALAGVAGAISAPIAGRIADRGLTRPGTALAMLLVIGSLLITHIGAYGSVLKLVMLVTSAIVLDFGVIANLVFGQRAIYNLGAEFRSRLNGLYMAIFFVGGAIGSALGGWAYAHGGWPLTSWVGIAFPAVALGYFATERSK